LWLVVEAAVAVITVAAAVQVGSVPHLVFLLPLVLLIQLLLALVVVELQETPCKVLTV